jgi:hypothetical protein
MPKPSSTCRNNSWPVFLSLSHFSIADGKSLLSRFPMRHIQCACPRKRTQQKYVTSLREDAFFR